MKTSIYIPNELGEYIKNYLADYPEKTLSSLIQETLEAKLKPNKSRLLELAGFASTAAKPTRETDQIAQDMRQRPEDKPIKSRIAAR
jgi:predicted DNA-binding protein